MSSDEPATLKQRAYIKRIGGSIIPFMTRAQASAEIDRASAVRLATPAQRKLLAHHVVVPDDLLFRLAAKAVVYLIACRERGDEVSPQHLRNILGIR